MRLRSIRIDDHCGTVTPVVSLPHESVMVFGLETAPDGLAHGRQRLQTDARRGASGDDRLVIVPEGVVLLGQQVRHRVTGGDIWEEPE